MNNKIIALMLAPFVMVAASAKDLNLNITWPPDGSPQPWRFCLQASASDRKAHVYFVIHPTAWTDFYIEPEPTLRSDGTFKTIGYIAEDKPGIFEGQRFEIMAVANPKVPLTEGMKLRSWPRSEASSAVIEVERSDHAGGDCPASAGQIPHAQAIPSTDQTPEPKTLEAPHPDLDLRFVRSSTASSEKPFSTANALRSPIASTWLFLGVWFLFVLFAICIDESKKFLDLLRDWCLHFWDSLGRFARFAGGQPVAVFPKLWAGCRSSAGRLWQSRGFEGSLKLYWVRLLLCPVLVIALLLSGGSEAYVVHSRLTLIFPPESNRPSGLLAAVSGDLRSEAGTELAASGAVVPAATYEETPLRAFVREVWSRLRQSGLWLVAIGLTALQSIAGALMFWDLTGTKPLEISPWNLLRLRPMPCVLFLILELALTVLAAVGGAEYSPDGVGPALPAVVAAAITFVLPLFTAYALHYSTEAAGDCLGPFAAAVSIAFVVIGAALALAAWTILLLACVASLGVAFASSCVVGGVLAVFMALAICFGVACRSIYTSVHREFGDWRKRGPSQILPAAATAVGCLLAVLTATYLVIK